MKILSNLLELINSMTREELKVARSYLTAFDTSDSEEELKSLKLFRILSKSKTAPSETEAKLSIYKGNVSNKTFYRLTTRLKEKLLESLVLDVNINRRDVLSEQYRVKHGVRKKTIQASLLLGRGKTEHAFELFDKIIEKGKEFEIYDELLETLRVKQQSLGLRKGKAEYERLIKEIQFYERCRSGLHTARDIYHRIVINIDFKANDKENEKILEQAIENISKLYSETRSKNISYLLHYLEIEKYQKAKLYKKAEEKTLSLVSLIKDNKAVYMKRSLGSAYLELANNCIYTYSFDKVIENCAKALPLQVKNSFNYAVTLEVEFYGCFYSGKLKRALEIVNQLLKIPNQSAIIISRRNYFKACILFMMEEYKSAELLLQKTKEIESDKEGWNVSIRLLSLMNTIERNQDIIADYKIESIRKHLERTAKVAEVRPRDVLIRRVLDALVKENFNYIKVYKSKEDEIEKLKQLKGKFAWEIRTPELISFDCWFESKAKNTGYYQIFLQKISL